MHNQKENNNQSNFHKQPEVPENQTAWKSNNHGIKETVKQNNQTGKVGGRENPLQGGQPCGWVWLPTGLAAARWCAVQEGLT